MRQIPHGRFRRRLTIAFIATAGISSAAIGLASYLLVRDTRLQGFEDRARIDAEANFLALEEEGTPLQERRRRQLVRRFQRRSAEIVVLADRGSLYASDPDADLDEVEAAAADTSEERFSRIEMELEGEPFLLVTTPRADNGIRAYFLYSEEGLHAGLATLAGILWRSWLAVVVIAGLVGNALARRTLRPVSRAGDAARSLAEGLLDTRLPIEREDEFGAWAVSFNEMAEALETKINELTAANERERRFTSDVSHELRTPISALVTSASMLEAKLAELDADTRWVSERTISQVRRVRALVEELLEISRLQSGTETVTRADVDLALIVSTVIANHGWRALVETQLQPVIVATDKARVERIVVNLMSNALEHGGRGVLVRVHRDDGEACVEVTDHGPGIPAEHLDHIFERFYKAEPSRPGGSGLGLAIASENVRLLDGRLSVETRPGGPTTFTCRLPLQRSDLEAPEALAPTP